MGCKRVAISERTARLFVRTRVQSGMEKSSVYVVPMSPPKETFQDTQNPSLLDLTTAENAQQVQRERPAAHSPFPSFGL